MKNNKGQALIEFIIILPILLILIISIIDIENIFIKKYSLENNLDSIVDMYREKKTDKINYFISKNNIEINYINENDFIKIVLEKNVKINSPVLILSMGKEYKIEVNRMVYKNE